jgi:hypothetical protein
MTDYPGNLHRELRPYNDHILTVTERSTPDPYVLSDKGTYYMVRITVSKFGVMTDKMRRPSRAEIGLRYGLRTRCLSSNNGARKMSFGEWAARVRDDMFITKTLRIFLTPPGALLPTHRTPAIYGPLSCTRSTVVGMSTSPPMIPRMGMLHTACSSSQAPHPMLPLSTHRPGPFTGVSMAYHPINGLLTVP